jgi:hypothetical protein
MQRHFWLPISLIFLGVYAIAQESSTDSRPTSLAQQAIAGKASRAADVTADSADQSTQSKSLGEVAREIQAKDLAKIKVTPEEAGKILQSVQPILKFASQDSGLVIRSAVKPRMIGRDDLRATMNTRKVDDEETKRLQAAELTLKKFGYVPREFATEKFVEGMYAELTAGFYDARTKMISLLNWVSPELQRHVLAHELTHALQDQNFNLIAWQKAGTTRPTAGRFEVSEAEAAPEPSARTAVIEGQAMVVLIDHLWKEMGLEMTLGSVPGVSAIASQYMEMVPIPDSPTIHASPVLLRDGLAFPYREGLVFELTLLEKGGKQMAFNVPFSRPPMDTHDILHPDQYLAQQHVHVPRIPDVSGILAANYDVVDSGGLGELDIRSLIKQYGTSRLAETVSSGWRGSSYLLVRRKDVPLDKATTSDLALIYISAWNSEETAHQFAKFYAETAPKRYTQTTALTDSCAGSDCPAERFQFNTEEGLVNIERRPKNLVLVTENFDAATSALLDSAVLKGQLNHQTADVRFPGLSTRYIGSPVFAELRAMCEQWAVAQAMRMVENR